MLYGGEGGEVRARPLGILACPRRVNSTLFPSFNSAELPMHARRLALELASVRHNPRRKHQHVTLLSANACRLPPSMPAALLV